MKAQILRGSKSEIAETVVRINGEIQEVIVFIDEPSDHVVMPSEGDIFAEMESFTVRVGAVDYSRDSLYTPLEGE